MRAERYKKINLVAFPPFCEFLDFVRQRSRIKNDPGFMFDIETHRNPLAVKTVQGQIQLRKGKYVTTMKTALNSSSSTKGCTLDGLRHSSQSNESATLSFHNVYGHTLSPCRTFRAKPHY